MNENINFDDGIPRNYEALERRLKALNVSEKDFNSIVRLSNRGQIGDPVWRILPVVENRVGIKDKGLYIIKLLIEEKKNGNKGG